MKAVSLLSSYQTKISGMPDKSVKTSKPQQVIFRLEEKDFIQFKKKLLDDGNLSVQKFCEGVVQSYLNSEYKPKKG